MSEINKPAAAPDQDLPLLKVKDLHVYYGAIHAVKGISLEVHEGEIVTLIGANGAGKSTTLKTIFEAAVPSTGMPPRTMEPWRGFRRPAMVFRVVDFPAPLAPIRVTISPSCTSRLMPFTAWMAP